MQALVVWLTCVILIGKVASSSGEVTELQAGMGAAGAIGFVLGCAYYGGIDGLHDLWYAATWEKRRIARRKKKREGEG